MDLNISSLFKKQIPFYIFLFGLGFLFFSCGPRKVHKTGLKFNTSAMTGSSGGGLILVGERIDTSGYFSTRIATPDPVIPTTVELPEGKWNFFAMTWDGSDNFTGTPRCDKFTGYKIPEDLNNPVGFILTKDKCYNSNAFNYAKIIDSSSDSSGEETQMYGDSTAAEKIPKLRLITCSNLEGISGSTSTCDFPLSKLGTHSSYKIAMGGTKYGLSTSILTTLESRCLSNTSLTNPIFETELRIGIRPDSPFGVNIHAYEDKNCSKYGTTYSFPKGLGHNTNLDSKTFPHSNSQSRNSIFIADNHLGYGTSTLSNISPTLNCQNTDGTWIHCLPGATTAHQNQSSFHSAKGQLKNLFGTSDALDPYQIDSSGDSSQGRKEIGVLGEMAFLMTGPIGAALFQKGLPSCQYIPTSGSGTINLSNNESALVTFLSPQKTIPSHYTGGGSTFDKRIGLSLNGKLEFLMEFRCPLSDGIPKVGWLRMNHKDENGTNESQVELWYDTTNTSSEKAELYIYNKHFDSHSSSINKSRSIIKFKKTGSGTFTAWLTGLGFQPGSSNSGGISPSSNYDFTTCSYSNSTSNCQTTCHDQSSSSSSGCPSIGSGDSPSSNPILNGISNLSTSSLADGDADGWSVLSPFSLNPEATGASPGSSSTGFYNYSYRYLVKGVMGAGQTSKISINSIYPSSCSVPSNLNSDNTAAWLKADSLGLSDGAAVSSWSDSFSNSSQDTLTQTNTAKKPTYSSNGLNGKPALYFDGGDNLYGATYGNNIGVSLNGQNGYTLFFVTHPEQISNSTSSKVMLLMGTSGTPKIRAIINSSNKFSINTRPRDGTQLDSNNSNETITSASILIAKTDFSGDSVDFYGSISRSTPDIGFPESNYSCNYTSGYPNPNLNLTLGMQYGDNNNPRYFKGYIAEIILMKTALSTSDINNVKTYLECKYNLNTSN